MMMVLPNGSLLNTRDYLISALIVDGLVIRLVYVLPHLLITMGLWIRDWLLGYGCANGNSSPPPSTDWSFESKVNPRQEGIVKSECADPDSKPSQLFPLYPNRSSPKYVSQETLSVHMLARMRDITNLSVTEIPKLPPVDLNISQIRNAELIHPNYWTNQNCLEKEKVPILSQTPKIFAPL